LSLPPQESVDLSLGVGEERTMRLASAGAGGYDWYPQFGGPDDVVRVTRSSQPPDPGPPGSPPRTASADTLVHVVALRPGRTVLTLEHRRPAAAGGEPLAVMRIAVEVTEAPPA
jgi:hypothetical protein